MWSNSNHKSSLKKRARKIDKEILDSVKAKLTFDEDIQEANSSGSDCDMPFSSNIEHLTRFQSMPA